MDAFFVITSGACEVRGPDGTEMMPLGCISAASRLHLGCISAAFRLHLG